jgi:hypothetical protein
MKEGMRASRILAWYQKPKKHLICPNPVIRHGISSNGSRAAGPRSEDNNLAEGLDCFSVALDDDHGFVIYAVLFAILA